MSINLTKLIVVRDSLLDQDVQAIVNAANEQLRGGGGIDGAIHRGAGPGLLAELKMVAPRGTKTGTAVVTQGHNLKQQFVIHTPGPVWSEHGPEECERLLASCYRSCLEAADSRQIQSLGFCSISTGIYGYPLERAAPLAVNTVVEYLREQLETTLCKVVFAMRGAAEYDAFRAALSQAHEQQPPEGEGREEIELTEEDDRILDEVWAELARERDAERGAGQDPFKDG